tara:strand:+ start:122 stop:277 length:156 start_codon:yes stop_codon:yes gene_type:complete
VKYSTPIGVPIERGGGKMVFGVMVCIDSYIIYLIKKIHPSYGRGTPSRKCK